MQIEKSKDGVLGIWTQCRRIVGIDETTELLRLPHQSIVFDEKINQKLNLSLEKVKLSMTAEYERVCTFARNQLGT